MPAFSLLAAASVSSVMRCTSSCTTCSKPHLCTLCCCLTLQLQKQLASTAALDGCLRSVGAAYAALMGRAHKEGAALAAQFLVDASGGPGVVTSKVLKLGDCSMKQLRNGDVYKVRAAAAAAHDECLLRSLCLCAFAAMSSDLQQTEPDHWSVRTACRTTTTPHGRTDFSVAHALWVDVALTRLLCATCCCCSLRAATRARARTARAATSSSTLTCMRASSGTTAWQAAACTASPQRAGAAGVHANHTSCWCFSEWHPAATCASPALLACDTHMIHTLLLF